jgi:G3E family GTPase
VLVNDFGAINIDAELVDGVEENTINLSNGCVCCEIRDDLVASLEQLLTRNEGIDYVLLEASGVSDPSGIVMTFLDRRYEGLLRLDSITCLVDAEAVFTHADDAGLSTLKMRQIAFADLVILNKVDLVGPTHLEVIHEWIGHSLKRVRIVEATRCDVPLEILLAVGRFDPVHAVYTPDKQSSLHSHGAHRMFETWSYRTSEPFDREKLREMVRRELPATIYRCKGIVHVADLPGKRFSLQAVGRRTELTELDDWEDRDPHSQIVAIGSQIESRMLENLFDACLERNLRE